MKGWIILCLSI